MKKITDVLLVLGLLTAIGFFVYVQRRDGNGIQPPPLILVTPSSAPTLWITTADPPQSSSQPIASIPTSVLAPTLTPTLVTSLKPTLSPASNPTGTATPTGLPTQAPVDEEIRAGIEQGNQIVEAIESFSQTQGYYPPTLSDLVPNYLSALPVTDTGAPFFYRVFDRTTVLSPEVYWVAFKVTSQDHVTCTFFRRLQYWDCNFDSP